MRSMRALLFSSLCFSPLLASATLAQEVPVPPEPVPQKVIELASCDVCLPSALPRGPLQVLFQPGFQAGVDHQLTPFKGLHFNGQEIANPSGEKIISNTTQLHMTYNVSPKAGFLISIPYHNRDYRRQGDNGIEQGTVSGIGDIVVRGRYAPITKFGENHTLVWTIEAGMKLPTGSSRLLREQGHHHGPTAQQAQPAEEHEHEEEGGHEHGEGEEHHHERGYLAHEGHDHGAEEGGGEEEHHETPVAVPAAIPEHTHNSAVEGHDLALGSGSVDGLIGTGVLWRTGNFFAAAGGQYALRSTGTAGYRYGDLLTWRVAPGYLFINKANQVVGLQVNISGEHHDPNRVFGQRDHGYTDIVYVGPEIVSQGENLSLNLGVDLPVQYHAEGLTLAPDYRARVNFNWSF